jgi:hypothetical protein
MKKFKLPNLLGSDRTNLEFRADFFNAFNRVSLAGVHSDLSDPLFGKSTSTYGARDIQFGLRLSF